MLAGLIWPADFLMIVLFFTSSCALYCLTKSVENTRNKFLNAIAFSEPFIIQTQDRETEQVFISKWFKYEYYFQLKPIPIRS